MLLLAAGCTTTPRDTKTPDAPDPSPADEVYARGVAEYADANYRIAEERFREAYTLYAGMGDREKAQAARNAMFRANRTYIEYSLNETEAA